MREVLSRRPCSVSAWMASAPPPAATAPGGGDLESAPAGGATLQKASNSRNHFSCSAQREGRAGRTVRAAGGRRRQLSVSAFVSHTGVDDFMNAFERRLLIGRHR